MLSSCADAKSAGLCEKAGTISTINNNFTNSMDLTIDIGKWSFGYAANAYKPALAFANTSEASNYDADRCRYFADASSLQEFVDSVGDISKDLVPSPRQPFSATRSNPSFANEVGCCRFAR